MSFEELLIKIARILDELKIVYCITGGYAVSILGRPRATFDIDIIIKLQTKELSRFAKCLKSLSAAGYLDEKVAKAAINSEKEFNFIHPESGLKVDFWVIRRNPIGLRELKRRIPRKIKNQTIYFISPEDLILSKLDWYKESQSDRHLEDAKSVLKFSKPNLNYIKKWAVQQSTIETFRKILKNNKV